MQDAFLKLYQLYGRVLWVFASLAGAFTFAIMIVIDTNAFLRKLVNSPLPAALEITQSLLVGAIMLPFAYALFQRDHVSTVFFTSRLSPGMRRGLAFFWSVVGFLLFAAITYGTFQYAMRSYRMNEQIWGATIQFSIWPSKMAVSLGTALISVQFLLDAVGTALVRGFNEQRPEAEAMDGHV